MRKLFFFLFTFSALCVQAQNRSDISELSQPRLIVGLVIDQMRWDYLTRYQDRYTDGGFRRLMREGYNCNRTLINYIPAITAVGHTSVYTGSVPAMTGIVGNNFYINRQPVYCTSDTTVLGLGTLDDNGSPLARASAGMMSPRNLLVTTMTDQLRLATNFRSKVIGVALKDRAAILPAGHAANAAYWMDSKSYNFVSSTYYMDKLPEWVNTFNSRHLGAQYVNQNLAIKNKRIKGGPWPLLHDAKTYVQSAPQGQKWEATIGTDLKLSPWGMTITFDMARAAIEGEDLGNNPNHVPDFLAVSISSTDMIGHKVSPNSIWMEDTYLRLDRDIETFLNYLDSRVGKGNYLFFLTADHAGSHNPIFRQEHNIPGDTWKGALVQEDLTSHLRTRFSNLPDKAVMSLTNMQVHFSDATHALSNYAEIEKATIDYLNSRQDVAYAFSTPRIPDYIPEPIRTYAINGYCPHRSGDIQIIFQSRLTEDYASANDLRSPDHIYKGTTHALWNPDDTHIPLIFFGWNTPHKWDNHTHYITDIAATITAMLNIQQPNACVGNAIEF